MFYVKKLFIFITNRFLPPKFLNAIMFLSAFIHLYHRKLISKIWNYLFIKKVINYSYFKRILFSKATISSYSICFFFFNERTSNVLHFQFNLDPKINTKIFYTWFSLNNADLKTNSRPIEHGKCFNRIGRRFGEYWNSSYSYNKKIFNNVKKKQKYFIFNKSLSIHYIITILIIYLPEF